MTDRTPEQLDTLVARCEDVFRRWGAGLDNDVTPDAVQRLCISRFSSRYHPCVAAEWADETDRRLTTRALSVSEVVRNTRGPAPACVLLRIRGLLVMCLSGDARGLATAQIGDRVLEIEATEMSKLLCADVPVAWRVTWGDDRWTVRGSQTCRQWAPLVPVSAAAGVSFIRYSHHAKTNDRPVQEANLAHYNSEGNDAGSDDSAMTHALVVWAISAWLQMVVHAPDRF